MAFLITGAQLSNKGAQSMLFITVSELSKRFPDKNCLFMAGDYYTDDNYVFKSINCNMYTKRICLNRGIKRAGWIVNLLIFDTLRWLKGRRNGLWYFRGLEEISPDEIDAIIDISGFNIGDKWPRSIHISFFDNILYAKRYNIPIYLMPQSFGPFQYKEKNADLKDIIARVFRYPRVIFAREKQGYDDLKALDLNNVVLSPDLVLQNQGIDVAHIYKNRKELKIPNLSYDNCVGIVPNQQCLRHGNREEIQKVYSCIIDTLLALERHVVIFRHSSEDLSFCQSLKEKYRYDKRVILIENDFSCLEYSEFVKQLNYLVCSRYHGIVHAYKNGIPVILLGWAKKYQELASHFNQNEYAFDISSDKVDEDAIISAVLKMEKDYEKERVIIFEGVKSIQRNSCFDYIERDMRSMGIQ